MEYVISIAKRYNHARTHYRDPHNRGIKGAKPVLGIYVMDEYGTLHFRKISRLLVPYYRSKLWKRRVCVCADCMVKFVGLVKKDDDMSSCPYCYGSRCLTLRAFARVIVKEILQETRNQNDIENYLLN